MYFDNDDFDIKHITSIEQIPEQVYCKLMEEYDDEELEAYIARDWDLISMDIATFSELYRIDSYGLTDEEMDTGDEN